MTWAAIFLIAMVATVATLVLWVALGWWKMGQGSKNLPKHPWTKKDYEDFARLKSMNAKEKR